MASGHQDHLPRKDLNKGVAHNTKADAKALGRVAAQQGEGTKKDASTPQPPRKG